MALEKAITTAPEVKDEPVAWLVTRDTDYESREYFNSEKEASENACLGVVNTHITPLYARPSPRIAALEAEVAKLRLAWDCAYNQAMENGQKVAKLRGAISNHKVYFITDLELYEALK